MRRNLQEKWTSERLTFLDTRLAGAFVPPGLLAGKKQPRRLLSCDCRQAMRRVARLPFQVCRPKLTCMGCGALDTSAPSCVACVAGKSPLVIMRWSKPRAPYGRGSKPKLPFWGFSVHPGAPPMLEPILVVHSGCDLDFDPRPSSFHDPRCAAARSGPLRGESWHGYSFGAKKLGAQRRIHMGAFLFFLQGSFFEGNTFFLFSGEFF